MDQEGREETGRKIEGENRRSRKEKNSTRTSTKEREQHISREPHENLSNFTLNMNERSEEERRDKHRRILDTLSKEGGNVTMRCWIVFRVTLKRKDKIRGREKLPFAFCSHLFCISRLPSSFSFELFVLYPHSLSFLYSILIPCPPYKVFFVKTRSSHSGMKHPSSVIWSREERLSSCIFMCVLFPWHFFSSFHDFHSLVLHSLLFFLLTDDFSWHCLFRHLLLLRLLLRHTSSRSPHFSIHRTQAAYKVLRM